MHDRPTHGIVHAGFRGMRRFVARKKSRCKLIGNLLVIPHDTIPSNVGHTLNRTFIIKKLFIMKHPCKVVCTTEFTSSP